jgi:DNA-binding NtrC family response regulator
MLDVGSWELDLGCWVLRISDSDPGSRQPTTTNKEAFMNRPPSILIVEDEDMVRINLEDFLEDEGADVKSAESGEKGLEFLKDKKFDVAVVDMRLPGMDGNTFIKKAKKIQPALSVIIHTGSAFYSLPPELSALGVTENHILLKPLSDMGILSRAIKELRIEN